MEERDDVEFEAENNEPPKGGDAQVRVAKLKSELAACETERKEYLDGWQRSKADFVNALKRFDEEKKKERERGVVQAAAALLPAFDALERAKEHGEVPEGFAAIVRQIESGFATLGLEVFGAAGEPFDPARHDALGCDHAAAEKEDDTVSAVLEKGWRIGDAVIRPARVRVARYAK